MQANHLTTEGQTMICKHCGYRQQIKQPSTIDGIVAQMDAFTAAHRHCKEAAPARPLTTDDVTYIAGFEAGCDYIVHEVEQWMNKTSNPVVEGAIAPLLRHLKQSGKTPMVA